MDVQGEGRLILTSGAARLGYTIKLLANAREDRGAIRLTVHPALVRKGTAIALLDGVLEVSSVIRVEDGELGEV